MLYQNLQGTVHYLEHMQEIDWKYREMDITWRVLITNIINNKLTFSKEGSLPMIIFRKRFQLN